MNAEHKRTRRVAVVGAGSCLARCLVERLVADATCADLLAIDLSPLPLEATGARTHALDLTAPDAGAALAQLLPSRGFDTIVHLIHLDLPAIEQSWAHELVSIGTLHLLNACAASAVAHVVAVSSTMCYGAHLNNPALLTEQHSLRGAPGCRWIEDQIDVEHQMQSFAAGHPETTVTVLRLAPLLGPSIDNFWTRRFTAPVVHTMLGFDPLMQFLHQEDATEALRQAIDLKPAGAFNIVPDDAIAMSRALRLLGRRGLPLPPLAARGLIGLLNSAQLVGTPPELIDYLRHGWVADGALAARQLGFAPRHGTADALRALARPKQG
ncbi:MAG: NAD-dependent epimerase/dehydratase family protein [Deltaproteobacteria bacterium]|nr:NAD-dependent epimerase/dehydratase family protein [Deltaproteobacteria bacterium]